MYSLSPHARFWRAATALLLAVLVSWLGAAAKHSQFERSNQPGYLAKAVKMNDSRVDPIVPAEHAARIHFAPPVMDGDFYQVVIPTVTDFSPVAFFSPPLRV